jgi:catechol 2,3-dioxygenase-like lactoylglutathione lyase family enzyme
MTQPLSRGVHHLALNTDDMKMTMDFYVGVLGMPLVHALKVPPGLGTGPGNRMVERWLETMVAPLPDRR